MQLGKNQCCVLGAEMPEVLEAARRSESDATCSSQDIPDVIQQVNRECQTSKHRVVLG